MDISGEPYVIFRKVLESPQWISDFGQWVDLCVGVTPTISY